MPVGLLRRQRARPCGPPSGRISGAVDASVASLLRRQRRQACGPAGRHPVASAVDARRALRRQRAALRAAIRSLLAREGVPLKLPSPVRFIRGRQRVPPPSTAGLETGCPALAGIRDGDRAPVHLPVKSHGSAPHWMPGLSAAAFEKSAPKADFSAPGHEKALTGT